MTRHCYQWRWACGRWVGPLMKLGNAFEVQRDNVGFRPKADISESSPSAHAFHSPRWQHGPMNPRLGTLIALTGALLAACDRLDTLAVIDSPAGDAIILDSIAVRSGDRVICVLSNVKQPCSRSTAEVVVSADGTDVDVQAGWAADGHVTVTVARGHLRRSMPSGLNGQVRIEYR